MLGELGQPLPEQRADEVLGAREVGLQDRELQVQGWVVRGAVIVGGVVG